jgi:putative tryptophan/tyrosine transport system substrate-binding protein
VVDRRTFIAGVGGGLVALPLLGAGQQPDRASRVGILDPGIPEQFSAFRGAMGELGYIDGKNVIYLLKTALGRPGEIHALAAALVALKPDILVTAASLPSRSLMQQTTSIPIVVASIGDAISAGIVHSLAQPEGNVTGLTFLNTELSAKRLELLKVALPTMRKVALFNDLNSQSSYLEETLAAAKGLGVEVQRLDLHSPEEFEQAFDRAKHGAAEAIDVLASPFFNANRVRLVRLAAQYRLPTIYESREYAVAGGLMTYGQDLAVLFRRAATYVAKILRGAKTTDLPWEQPTKFELVINLKTAKALGITIPQSLLLRADEVIQ